MKKRGILFGTIGLLAILICGCNKTQAEKGNKPDIETVEWRSSYITFLQDINKNNSKQGYEFVIKDLDGDAIPELIVKEKLKLTVYRQNKEIEEVGSYNFATGTTRLFSSERHELSRDFLFLC